MISRNKKVMNRQEKYEFYGIVKYIDLYYNWQKKNEPFQFDPGIFMDDDGKLYLYTGFAGRKTRSFWMDRNRQNMAVCFELKSF